MIVRLLPRLSLLSLQADPEKDEHVEITHTREDSLASYRISGPYNSKEVAGFIRRIGSECRAQGMSQVLVDLSAVTGSIGFWERLQLGRTALREWGNELRVALVYDLEGRPRMEVPGSKTVVLFSALEDAQQWLAEERNAH